MRDAARHDRVGRDRRGRLERTSVVFADEAHLLRIIQRIVSRVGRRVDEASPMVDARLPDGSRVNAIVPPLALGGPKLSIRRFGVIPLAAPKLAKAVDDALAAMLADGSWQKIASAYFPAPPSPIE